MGEQPMSRVLLQSLLGVLILSVAGNNLLRAQIDKKTSDRIYIIDPATKKEDDVYGKIEEESPVGLKVKVRRGKDDEMVSIPTANITRIYYYTPDVNITEYNRGFVNEANWEKASGAKRQELFDTALARYRETEQQLTGHPEASRFLRYRIAMLLVKASKDDPSKRDDAIKALKDFTATSRTSWAIVPALITQASMLEEMGRSDEAREAYEALATLPGVPPELARRSDLLVGKMYLRAGKFADAQKRFTTLSSKLSAGDAEKPFVDVYLTEAQIGQGKFDGADKRLLDAIRATDDGKVRGLGHNLLGELHQKKGELEEAFWHYLRVDALYNDDPEEQARALFHLATLFDKVKKDPTRAADCKRRLMDDTLKGTRYQKRGRDAGMAPPTEEKSDKTSS
jgi:tetratricopeptide (TPR) repeat protein